MSEKIFFIIEIVSTYLSCFYFLAKILNYHNWSYIERNSLAMVVRITTYSEIIRSNKFMEVGMDILMLNWKYHPFVTAFCNRWQDVFNYQCNQAFWNVSYYFSLVANIKLLSTKYKISILFRKKDKDEVKICIHEHLCNTASFQQSLCPWV